MKKLKKKGKKIKKNKGGRPPKYSDAEVLMKAGVEYFKICDKTRQLPEKAGLCIELHITRETYSAYRKDARFSDTIKQFDLYIESNWVRRLAGQSPAGAIFYLKNAFKEHYKDRQETDITSGGERLQITGMKILHDK